MWKPLHGPSLVHMERTKSSSSQGREELSVFRILISALLLLFWLLILEALGANKSSCHIYPCYHCYDVSILYPMEYIIFFIRKDNFEFHETQNYMFLGEVIHKNKPGDLNC